MTRIDIETAQAYRASGLSVLPASKADKRPTEVRWKKWMGCLPTEIEVAAWFSNRHDAICIVAGRVSGNLECLDFDNKGELFEAWAKRLTGEEYDPLVIERTQSGGFHVYYRCEKPVEGNMKLARGIRDGSLKTLIETRGEGGLALCAPSEGYEIVRGDLAHVPVISASARERLLEAARALDEMPAAPAQGVQPEPVRGETGGFLTRPGDDFAARGDIRPYLVAAGWQFLGTQPDGNGLWRRPGKTEGGHSATFNGKVFYVFSSNAAPFEPNKGYGPFQVYAMLEHAGDFTSAANALLAKGYGKADDPLLGVDLSHLKIRLPTADAGGAKTTAAPATESGLISIGQLAENYPKLREPVIHGLLRRGETMNLIAPPKLGKSWLVGSLAIAVARGMPWLGFPCEYGRVVVVDNELHHETIADRYRTLLKGLDIRPDSLDGSLFFDVQRGNLKSVDDLILTPERYASVQPSLMIIDAFYRTLPDGTEENDNAAMTHLYNKLDKVAGAVGCAIVLVHHTSKGNQALKSTTDSGAGAGAISRAADAHVVLRKHKEKDCAVFDAVARSWPPPPKFCIRFNYPAWDCDDTLGTDDIEGAQNSAANKVDVPTSEIIKGMLEMIDPEKPLTKGTFINKAVKRIRSGKVRKKDVNEALEEAINEGYIVLDKPEHPKRGQQAAKYVLLGPKPYEEQGGYDEDLGGVAD